MELWEYLFAEGGVGPSTQWVVTHDSFTAYDDELSIEDYANARGGEGWELVASHMTVDDFTFTGKRFNDTEFGLSPVNLTVWRLIFRRPKREFAENGDLADVVVLEDLTEVEGVG